MPRLRLPTCPYLWQGGLGKNRAAENPTAQEKMNLLKRGRRPEKGNAFLR